MSGGQHLHTLYRLSRDDGRDTGIRSCSQYTLLNVGFKDDSSCDTNGERRHCGVLVTFVLADECGFLQLCRLLMVVRERVGHEVRVSWNDFASGCEYIAEKSLNKRGNMEHVDG